jgi:hypothetical protein
MSDSNRLDQYKDFMSSGCIFNNDVIHTIVLEELGFFTAPASTKYHGAYEGGLFDHSLAVANILVDITEKLGLEWERPESPYIVGMYHDLCKCDNYVKINSFEEVAPVGIRYKHNPNMIIPGHGDKSVIIAQKYIELTDEEIACIRWHMGAYEKDPKMWDYYNRAVAKYPNVLWTHTADMLASHVKNI